MTERHLSTETLVEYLHGELAPADDAAAHLHLVTCGACRDAYARESRLTELLRAHARAEERDLPPAVVHGVRAAIARENRPRWVLPRWMHPALVAAAIVAGILVGVYSSQGGWHSRARASSIDASYYLEDQAALARTTPLGEEAALPAALTSSATHADEHAVVDATH